MSEQKEYIERKAAIKAAQEGANIWDGGTSCSRDAEIQDCINKVPPADVKPVVRGEWHTKEYMYGDKTVGQEDMWIERLAEKGDVAYCSVCRAYEELKEQHEEQRRLCRIYRQQFIQTNKELEAARAKIARLQKARGIEAEIRKEYVLTPDRVKKILSCFVDEDGEIISSGYVEVDMDVLLGEEGVYEVPADN